MTSAVTTTTAPAASPVLGAQPDRPAGGEASTDSVQLAEAAGPVVDDGPPIPTVAVYEDEEGRVHYASPVSKLTRAHVAAGEWTEVEGSAHPFDPTTHKVREVVAYLNQYAGDADEVARVKAAEAAGENRPTIAAWSPAGE